MHDHCIRKLKMPPDEWRALEQLAIQTNSANRSGQRVHEPSWLALVRRIARGELTVSEPPHHREHLRRIDEAIAQQEAQARRVQGEYTQLNILEAGPA